MIAAGAPIARSSHRTGRALLQGGPQMWSSGTVAPTASNKITFRNNYVYYNIDNAQQP